MKVDVSKKIHDLYGTPFASPRSSQEAGVVQMTYGEVFINTLLAPSNPPAPYKQCKEQVELAERIKNADGEIDLEDNEIELLKGLVPMTNNLPLIVARAVGLLEKEG